MSRKKSKKRQAVPEEILAEGSGPVGGASDPDAQALADALSDLSGEPAAAVMSDSDVQQADTPDSDASDVPISDASDVPDSDTLQADGQDPDAASMSGETDGSPSDSDEVPDEAPDGESVEAGVLPTSAATMDDAQLCRLVEALIFAADRPIALPRLRQLTRISDVRRLEQALATLAEQYVERGIALQQVSGGYQFRTNTSYSPWVQQLIAGRPVRLSRAQLETLAIVAYRQPITRPEIDEIRGVDSSATLRLLLDRALIRVLGKREEVGRPILYGTTKEFLDFFSLGDLRELPTLREYSELTAESRQVMSDRLGVPLAPEDVGTASYTDAAEDDAHVGAVQNDEAAELAADVGAVQADATDDGDADVGAVQTDATDDEAAQLAADDDAHVGAVHTDATNDEAAELAADGDAHVGAVQADATDDEAAEGDAHVGAVQADANEAAELADGDAHVGAVHTDATNDEAAELAAEDDAHVGAVQNDEAAELAADVGAVQADATDDGDADVGAVQTDATDDEAAELAAEGDVHVGAVPTDDEAAELAADGAVQAAADGAEIATLSGDIDPETRAELDAEARADLDAAEDAVAARTGLDAHVAAMTSEHESMMTESPKTFDPNVVEPDSEPNE